MLNIFLKCLEDLVRHPDHRRGRLQDLHRHPEVRPEEENTRIGPGDQEAEIAMIVTGKKSVKFKALSLIDYIFLQTI